MLAKSTANPLSYIWMLWTQADIARIKADEFSGSTSVETYKLQTNAPAAHYLISGLALAVLNDTDRVELRPVKVQRDFGREVELEGELATGTRVVLFPPVDLTNGDAVAPVEQAASKPAR